MPQPSPPQPQQQMLKGRPVSSVDEARAAQIDYDGSLFIFPDITGKKIYTRQVMLDGTSMFNTYSLDESVDAKKTPYVMRDEFENTVSDINTALLTLLSVPSRSPLMSHVPLIKALCSQPTTVVAAARTLAASTLNVQSVA